MEEIKGYVEHIVYRNEDNGYTVFHLNNSDGEVTCVGSFHYIEEGELLRLKGGYTTHKMYGLQFAVEESEICEPEDLVSIERYLGSGAIKGIGAALAARIVRRFGDDTMRIVEEEPERLAEIKGISEKKAMEIAEQMTEKADMRRAMIFLQKYGISLNLGAKIYQKYGQSVYGVLQENPYRLAEDISGVGFRIADDIASRIGIHTDSDYRIRSGMLYTLLQASGEGHIYLPKEELFSRASRLLGVDVSYMEKHLMDMVVERKLILKETEEGTVVYPKRYYNLELDSARMLCELNILCPEDEYMIQKRIERIEKETGTKLDEMQKQAVISAAQHGLFILTGGPGTGKTTTINAIIRYFEEEGAELRLAAPTGRAAKRMTETCGFEAQTIHRLLEIVGSTMADKEDKKNQTSSLGMSFDRNEDNPLEADVIIVDEMSMVDINIMNSLLKAVAVGTRLILVGDVDQLPSVGPGNVLKDIIASECFPVVKLEKIFRQAAESEIITNAHKINKGDKVTLNKYSKDFLFIHRNGPDAIIAAMKTVISEKLPKYVNADVSELQILTPSRKSSVGVDRLNTVMQEYLNPPDSGKMEKKVGDTIFREGDKVMQIKNDYQLEWEKKNRYGIAVEQGSGVFNGDTGIIDDINNYNQSVTVKFEDGRYVDYEFTQLDELELAYAITVHKAQGSEYPAVIIPMYQGPRMLMNRNILYTAVTRARKCVCMIGDERIFNQMAENVSETRRYSSLDERIKEIKNIE